ncbi:MAG: Arc family DNA-binding protein [Proteobacteria bacterium]|nr:Arc family DNA-binding protein [Pseudomonadota bacterium]
MSVNLSIKNVPDHWVKQLRQRADSHHRSLQGELMTMIEKSLESETVLSPEDLLIKIQHMGLHTSSESMEMIREDRGDH